MKYSKKFNESFDFYFRMRKKFNFSGGDVLKVIFDEKGDDAKLAFFKWESTGKIVPTKHPLLFHALLKSKASCNFHVKELYSRDLANGHLSRIELEEVYQEINPPEWFRDAVENYKEKWKI